MQFLTDFADQAVVLPLLLAVALSLGFSGWRRAAWAWCIAVPATLAVLGLLKLAIFAHGSPSFLPELRSPSGHTASAALVYGGLACLLATRTRPMPVALLASALFASGIGLTRLALHVHSPADVMVGAAIGIAGALALARLAGARPAGVRLRLPAAAVIAVLLLFHGHRLEAEPWLHALASSFR